MNYLTLALFKEMYKPSMATPNIHEMALATIPSCMSESCHNEGMKLTQGYSQGVRQLVMIHDGMCLHSCFCTRQDRYRDRRDMIAKHTASSRIHG